MDVQLRQLRTYLAVVDEGTFTAAAENLGVSQAAVSRTVAALEQVLGARLLQRSTRHVTLTGTGTRVAAAARRVLAEVTRLYQQVAKCCRTSILALDVRVGTAQGWYQSNFEHPP